VTIADLANTKVAQGYIPALYNCHEAVSNTIPEPPIMTECLFYTSDKHTGAENAYETFSKPIP
jgi:hypothetical protein